MGGYWRSRRRFDNKGGKRVIVIVELVFVVMWWLCDVTCARTSYTKRASTRRRKCGAEAGVYVSPLTLGAFWSLSINNSLHDLQQPVIY